MNSQSAFLKTALTAVAAAEEVLAKYFQQALVVERKADESPATKADREAEAVIREIIQKEFPDHGFLGEEYGKSNTQAEFQWCIDPIDGTKNFIHGLPFFSTELALFQGDEVILGVSNSPLLKRKVWAEKNRGAWLNGDIQLHVSNISNLKQAYLSTGSIKHFEKLNLARRLPHLNQQSLSLRSFGESWSYTYLASGNLDGILEAYTNAWDVAAGSIIVREAGGSITDLYGKPLTEDSHTFFASNSLLHNTILEHLHAKK